MVTDLEMTSDGHGKKKPKGSSKMLLPHCCCCGKKVNKYN